MVRRKYTDEFKKEAVKLAQGSGVPMSQTAKELGIGAELLRRELKRVTEERDILKKAMGIFTRELP